LSESILFDFHVNLYSPPGLSASNEESFLDVARINKQIEDFFQYSFTKRGVIRNDIVSKPINKPFRDVKLKKITFCCSITKAW